MSEREREREGGMEGGRERERERRGRGSHHSSIRSRLGASEPTLAWSRRRTLQLTDSAS